MLSDVVCDLRHVGIVQCSIDLVQNEERGWLVAVHREEESQGGHRFLATREVLHVSKSLERRHGVVFDAVQIRFIGIPEVQEPSNMSAGWTPRRG